MDTIENRIARLETRVLSTEEQQIVLSNTVARLESSVTEIRKEIGVLATKFDVHAVSEKVDLVRTIQLAGAFTSGVTLLLLIIGLLVVMHGGI